MALLPRKMALSISRQLCLLVLPLVVILAHSQLWPGHIWVYNWGEPDFGYLLNSADLHFGSPPAHTDHPGTTVQSLGVAVIAGAQLAHLGDKSFSWYDDLLLRPSHYHLWTSLTLAAVAALGLWAMGAALLNHGYSLGLGLFLQLLPFLAYNTWHYIPRVSPEKMLLFLNCALVAWLACQNSAAARKTRIFPLVLGMILGFALATKYNTAPLLGFLLLVPSVRGFILASAATAFSFFTFTLPMAEVYRSSFLWLGRILTHQGLYGKGQKGMLPETGLLGENFQILWGDDSYFLLACLLALLLGLLLAWRKRDRDCLVAVAVLVAHFLLVLKHPATRYLIPMEAPLLLVAFRALHPLPSVFSWMGVLAILPLMPEVIAKSCISNLGMQQNLAAFRQLESFKATHQECAWAYVSPLPIVEWAMSAGNGSAARRHTEALVRLHPNALSYDLWPPRFHRFSAALPLAVVEEKMEAKGCLYLGGFSLQTGKAFLEHAPFQYEVVLDDSLGGPFVLRAKKILTEGAK